MCLKAVMNGPSEPIQGLYLRAELWAPAGRPPQPAVEDLPLFTLLFQAHLFISLNPHLTTHPSFSESCMWGLHVSDPLILRAEDTSWNSSSLRRAI